MASGVARHFGQTLWLNTLLWQETLAEMAPECAAVCCSEQDTIWHCIYNLLRPLHWLRWQKHTRALYIRNETHRRALYMWHRTATRHIALQHTATHCNTLPRWWRRWDTGCEAAPSSQRLVGKTLWQGTLARQHHSQRLWLQWRAKQQHTFARNHLSLPSVFANTDTGCDGAHKCLASSRWRLQVFCPSDSARVTLAEMARGETLWGTIAAFSHKYSVTFLPDTVARHHLSQNL